MPETAPTPAPPSNEKTCPDCGGQVSAGASLCRHCGYTFPLGKQAARMPSQLTSDLAAAPPDTRPLLYRPALYLLVLPLVALAVIGFGVLRQRAHQPGWSTAVSRMEAPRSYDGQFAEHVGSLYAADQITAEVRAANGVCLVNLPGQSASGMSERLAGKLTAFTLACDYAAWRKRNGDSPVAAVTLFADGKRFLQAAVDGNEHPELIP